jgi:molecular chaperone DnaK
VVGIDLGTTNSLAAVRTGKTARVLRDRDGEALIPSIVSFQPDGSTIVGRAAKALRLSLPDRTVFSVKRLIGRSMRDVAEDARSLPYEIVGGERNLPRIRIGAQHYSPEAISALVLQQVKTTAEQALGQPVREAVITVPAWFDDAQRQATKDAATLAGLVCVRILNEPTAAALAYGIDGSKDGVALVYDLGAARSTCRSCASRTVSSACCPRPATRTSAATTSTCCWPNASSRPCRAVVPKREPKTRMCSRRCAAPRRA